MTETGSTVVERINAELNYDGVSHWEDICVKSADVRALLAVVEAARNHRSHWPKSPSMTGRKLDEALAALHSQASDEGKPE